MSRPSPVAVVGAGIAGIACARVLQHRGVPFEIFDRGRVVGGRMASRRLRDSGTPHDGHVMDIGASYFTVQDQDFASIVRAWVDEGVARPWTDTFHVATGTGITGVRTGPMRYASSGGLRSIIEHQASTLPPGSIHGAVQVAAIVIESDAVTVDGREFGAVALCLPDPQARALVDTSSATGARVDAVLAQVDWDPVIAVMAVFPDDVLPRFDGIFINDSPVLTWAAHDGRRRGDGAPVVIAHVHPELAAQHLTDPSSVIEPAIAALLPVLGIDVAPSCTGAMRWTYARPTTGRIEPCWFDGALGVGLAGDSWADGPKVESAWVSGHALGAAVSQWWRSN